VTGDNNAFKILLLGEIAVGKTSIAQRYVHKIFERTYKSTMGLDILAHNVLYKDSKYALQIWDFGGQDCFKHIREKFYDSSHGVILIFSLTDKSSLERLEQWINETRPHLENRIPLVLAANKNDLTSERTIDTATIARFINQHDLAASFFYTSAKTGENISNLFYRLVERIVEKN